MFSGRKAASASSSYQISRSLRFNSADSANLSRTFGTPTNANVWTFSCWIKRGVLGTDGTILGRSGSLYPVYCFNATTNSFGVYDSGSAQTTAVFRDPSAWYHLVIQRTDSTTVTVYFNGVSQLTATSQTNAFNLSGSTYTIGKSNAGEYFDGYMTEINFIDGQALTPSSFGKTNSSTGVWEPKAYSYSYGTNGFYLNFSDNSNTTAATLGKDYSGNGNNFTPNNFSVTAGAGNDSLVDVPTPYGIDTGVGGTVRGNYCTANPLDMNSTLSIRNGNLDVVESGGNWLNGRCTFGMSSGKWYFESTVTSGSFQVVGIANSLTINTGYNGGVGNWAYSNDGAKIVNGVYTTPYGASFTINDVIGIAFDADTGTLTMYKNGASQGTLASGLSANTYFPWVAVNASTVSMNFGQRAFAYTAPSGFKALCTQNLPTPTIGATAGTRAGKYFNTVLYTGNGSSQSITGVGFQPDLVWGKSRSAAYNHGLLDSVRGISRWLGSNSTSSEDYTAGSYVTAFNSDGFTVGTGGVFNNTSDTYVAWNWKANGSGSSNTAGSITSTVSASTTSGFSIVTYTGNGTAGATRGHGLGVAPSMILIKGRTNVDSWHVYHSSLGNTQGLLLETTSAAIVSPYFWNDTSPSSTVFTTNNGTSNNSNGVNYVAYCFASIAGFSAFGSYTGNGSADGPFVFTGFRPAFVMVKRSSSSGTNWQILDTKRSTYNVMADYLYASAANAESYDTNVGIDSLSNGFKIRGTDGNTNTSTATYIYMAFAESPFKYSLAR